MNTSTKAAVIDYIK